MVEIIKCPNCQRQLQVPAEHLGQTVQCPECRGMFVARVTTVSAQPMPAPTKPRHDDVDEMPRRRRRRERDDFDDEDDDDDDFGDYRQPRGLRNRLPAHRGGMILAIGLVALVGGFSFCGAPFLLGPVAWVMGSWDLREIRERRMDPDGEGMTRAGQICGIVATVLLLLSLPLFYFWIMLFNGGL